jgi:uncharacterized protein (UPF0264 family)
MKLLVSVTHESEAVTAIDGGADIIDAKDPTRGPLGALALPVFRLVVAAVGQKTPVTAALGDATDEQSTADMVLAYGDAGAGVVKIGFAGITDVGRVTALLAAAAQAAAGRFGIFAVAYADAERVNSLNKEALRMAASISGASGVLLDTADKRGPGLLRLVDPPALARWTSAAHDSGLQVGLAGQLSAEDLECVVRTGADIAGVRGAACDGGRTGRVEVERVRRLRALCRSTPPGRATRRTPTGCSC